MSSRQSPFFYLALGLVASACQSPAEYAAEADDEVYALVSERRAALFEDAEALDIEPNPRSLRQRVLAGEVASLEQLGLAQCLEIAAENQRDLQRRQESLYLAALDVTLERWLLGPILAAGADAELLGLGAEAHTASADSSASLTAVLGSGAILVGQIGLNVFRDLLSGEGWQATSNFSLALTQPLLRGAGKLILYEPLTQAERSLVYEVREFERFRRELAVNIAGQLLRILQQADTIENERKNFERVSEIRKRNEALAAAGRLSDIQVDQASQDELSSENRLIDVRQDFESQLDGFKLFLGLPPAIELTVNPGELTRLAAVDLGDEADFRGLEATVAIALARRPDFLVAVDRVLDAERQAQVAADALRLGFDLVSQIDGTSGTNQPLRYNFNQVSWSLGLALDLPVNRLPERNAYRSALITWQRSARDADLARDNIEVALRDDLRNLTARRESFAIQENAVALAAQRVESSELNQKAGRASTRDLLEAQSALVSSQNALTRALIDYTLARLTMVLDMGLLRVTEDGISIENYTGAAVFPSEISLPTGEAITE
ncbi:MAG: TolC family protein [bacterium]|nr:hypothetical protein [Planctomycetota bacterium]HIL51269.1 hypothetical protein [Planctomycetota bacterium]